jgi:serine/threonine-protein kinase
MSHDHDNGRGNHAPRPRAPTPSTTRSVDPSFVKALGSRVSDPPSAHGESSESEAVSLSGISSASNPGSGSYANIEPEFVEAQRTDDEDGRPVVVDGKTRRIRPDSTPPGVPPRDVRLGETLVGRYRVEKLIGKGGMGRVYLATQFPLNRAVAVKILSPEFQRKDPQFVRRFFLEAATAARLNHPNTITVYDYGETERGELFIAMEYLKGRPLSRVISADGAFSPERTVHISMQIIRALREAHAKGIIHRDLKPGNIMLLDEGDDADFAKVLDFGLVKLFNTGADNAVYQALQNAEEGNELTRAGMFLGSPKYMSPEQIQGHDLDPRTDIYSLGIIMYQMLAGRVPFRGSSSVEIIYKHVNQAVPAIHELNPEADAPPELEAIVQRTLAKDRTDRYASMSDLLAAMKDVRRVVTGGGSISASIDLMSQYPYRDTGQVAPEFPLAAGGLSGSVSVASARGAAAIGGTVPASRPDIPLPVPSAVPGRSSVPPRPNVSSRPTIPQNTPAPMEAAFVDANVADESKAELRADARKSAPGAGGAMRLAPYVGAVGLMVGLGAAAYFLAAPPATAPSASVTPSQAPDPRATREVPPPSPPAPTAVAEPKVSLPPPIAPSSVSTLSFRSSPDGARVYEDGKLLGTTPFEHEVDRPSEGYTSRTFVFKKDGFLDETMKERIDTASLKIRTALRPVPAPPPPPVRDRKPTPTKEAPRESPRGDYKDNPY